MSDLHQLYLVACPKTTQAEKNKQHAKKAIANYYENKAQKAKAQQTKQEISDQISDLQPIREASNAEVIDYIYSANSPYFTAYERAYRTMLLPSGR